jgi:hypothetical protein
MPDLEKTMQEYHKIQTVYLRDPKTKFRTLLMGEFAEPEFAYLSDNEWAFTEKVDGTNIRVMYDGGNGLRFGGKTDAAVIPKFLLDRLLEIFGHREDFLMGTFHDGVCLYGEGYGTKIQKGGGNYRPDQSFVLFDARVGNYWLRRNAVEEIAESLGIEIVPIIGTGTLRDMVALAEQGFTSQWGNFTAEGIVARPTVELQTRGGRRIITKIKQKDFAPNLRSR